MAAVVSSIVGGRWLGVRSGPARSMRTRRRGRGAGAHAVPARALGLVQRLVGGLNERSDIGADFGNERDDTDAHGDGTAAAGDVEAHGFDVAANSLRQDLGVAQGAIASHDDEFFAAVAA